MAEHDDDNLRKIAHEMRQCVFAVFGQPEDMDEQQMDEVIRTMMALHMGEFVEWVARFKGPELPLRDAIMKVIDAFIEANGPQIDTILHVADPRAYLELETKH